MWCLKALATGLEMATESAMVMAESAPVMDLVSAPVWEQDHALARDWP